MGNQSNWRNAVEDTGEVSIHAVADYLGRDANDVKAFCDRQHGSRYVGGVSQYLVWREDAEELERLTTPTIVRGIEYGQHAASGKWWARCHSPRLGNMEQWGQTHEEALENLRKFATQVNGERWPELKES